VKTIKDLLRASHASNKEIRMIGTAVTKKS
jgi:hypothetical protein